MHDPRLSYIYMSKDSLLQCMHEAAAKHGTGSISSISFRCQTKLGFNFVEPLWYGRSWPRSQSEREKSNLEWKKNTFILSNYNELVDILSSGMETPWNLGATCFRTEWRRRARANFRRLLLRDSPSSQQPRLPKFNCQEIVLQKCTAKVQLQVLLYICTLDFKYI